MDIMAVLVMGFEPFLDFDENPTETVVEGLNGRTIEGELISGVVLPVNYELVEQEVLGALKKVKPSLAIGFGLAQKRERITPEKIAINYRSASEPDNAGVKIKDARIDESQPDGLFTNLPVESLAVSLNSLGIPAAVSFSAGAYLCNNAMFVIVREAVKQGFSGGFIHVPCHSEWVSKRDRPLPSLPLSTITRAAEHCVAFCVRADMKSH
jgi:pyroglutamyl-peptidase